MCIRDRVNKARAHPAGQRVAGFAAGYQLRVVVGEALDAGALVLDDFFRQRLSPAADLSLIHI